MYCPKCGGILAEKHTKVPLEDGNLYHYYCADKIFREKKAKFDKDFDEKIQERRKWLKEHNGDPFAKE